MSGRVAQIIGPGPYGGFATSERRLHDYMQLPYIKLNEIRGALDSPWFEKWIRGKEGWFEWKELLSTLKDEKAAEKKKQPVEPE